MTGEATELTQWDGWTIRQRIPPRKGPYPLIVMLHGWTGDEDAMWVFASRLPEQAVLLAPRGLFPSPHGGYSWRKNRGSGWPVMDEFLPAVERLEGLLEGIDLPQIDRSRVSLLGFSQGAALALAFSLVKPDLVFTVAGLSGFLPNGSNIYFARQPLLGKRAFLAHGTLDELVPVERARMAIAGLKQAGADVTYCEDDVGHKLSANCFRGLQAFFR